MRKKIIKAVATSLIIIIITASTTTINFPVSAEESSTTKSTNLNQKQVDEMVEKSQQEMIKIKNDPKFKEFFDKQAIDKKTQEGNSMISNETKKSIEKYNNTIKEYLEAEKKNLPKEWLKEREQAEAEEGWNPISSYKYYLFISSSIPENILYTYAQRIYDHNKKNPDKKIVMVIRGCINSCEKVMPTINWIKKIITIDGKYEKGLEGVEVWIDPTLYREFGIKKVPCLASKETQKIVCGDWDLNYLLQKTQ
jgi:uncharacterized protein YaaR (DUF327 family)